MAKGDGSSPRVWGTRQPYAPRSVRSRFIPTRVGNTHARSSTAWHRPVHPHACGEHTFAEGGIDNQDGSSPRVWGTLFLVNWQ